MRFPRALRVLSRFDEMRARIWERSVLQSVSCVVAVTGEDQAKFQAMGIRATSVVPNCIDTSAFRHVAPNTSARNVLFVGNYEYAPNIEAVKRLCDAIMPMVWRSYPDATLSICGYKTPREWSRRWTDKRIVFTGYVSQLADVHATATVFVAPIESGGGSKLKVLEAMASSLPIVATSEGMSGLDVRPGIHFLAGETDGEISRSIGIAFADPKKACSLGTMAREYVVRQHDWTVAADMLERIYMEHTRWSTPDGAHQIEHTCGPNKSLQPGERIRANG
jgi:glycosyltransferase involved in cell wall biosynthesis